MRTPGKLLSGMLVGAGVMYLLDPDRGGRRRALLRDQGIRAWHKIEEGIGTTIARPRVGRRGEFLQENWSPALRVLAGSAGGAALARGLVAGGSGGGVAMALGSVLLARAATNLPVKRLIGIGGSRRGIEIQKIINVAAPIETVWELWSNFESFPRFMSHIKQVRKIDGLRSHWTAVGPGGVPIEWNAEITEWKPNESIAWKSVEGSVIEQAGRVQFRPRQDGTTEIDIRLSYNPPGGAVGQGIASLLGSNSRKVLEEDLVRLKSLLEEGKTSEGELRAEELPGTSATGAAW